jgi:hypothetical protein
MIIDGKRSLLEALERILTDDFERNAVEYEQ